MASNSLEGVNRVREWNPATLKMRTRKIKRGELIARYRLMERTQAESDAIRKAAGLEPVPENFYRLALRAEMERVGHPDSIAPAKTQAKTVSAAQSREIAMAALSLIGLNYPKTPAEAEALLAELSVGAVA